MWPSGVGGRGGTLGLMTRPGVRSGNGSSRLLQTSSNSPAFEHVRTVSAKINDSDGLGMGAVYFRKRCQIAQLVKI
jgi:hypothetical protein